MMTQAEYLDKYYTVKGQQVLHTRLKTLAELYYKKLVYPYRNIMFGFPPLVIKDKIHHQGMMDELSQILNIKMED